MSYKTRKQQIEDAREIAYAIVQAHANRYRESELIELDKPKKISMKSEV